MSMYSVTVVICTILVKTQTHIHRQLLTGYTTSSALYREPHGPTGRYLSPFWASVRHQLLLRD